MQIVGAKQSVEVAGLRRQMRVSLYTFLLGGRRLPPISVIRLQMWRKVVVHFMRAIQIVVMEGKNLGDRE